MHTLIVSGVIMFFLMAGGLSGSDIDAADRSQPARIGALTPAWGPTPQIVGLRDGLLALGYREGEQFVIGVRFTQGDLAALDLAARQLIQYGVDLIFTHRDEAARAAQEATTQIPIVFTGVNDPIGMGLIQSFNRPGGNITGVTDLESDLGPKRLEMFQKLVPHLKTVLYPYAASDTHSAAAAQTYRQAAQYLGLVLVERTAQTETEARAMLANIRKGEVDGILRPVSPSLNIPGFILEVATQHGLPTMFSSAFWVERGAFASYGPDEYASGRQAARLVGKILQGAKPADIPVEVNQNIEFAVNLKIANTLGLSIPPEVLFQANRIVR